MQVSKFIPRFLPFKSIFHDTSSLLPPLIYFLPSFLFPLPPSIPPSLPPFLHPSLPPSLLHHSFSPFSVSLSLFPSFFSQSTSPTLISFPRKYLKKDQLSFHPVLPYLLLLPTIPSSDSSHPPPLPPLLLRTKHVFL